MRNRRRAQLTMRVSATVFVGVSLLCYPRPTRAKPLHDRDQEVAQRLWEQVIAAKGGRERLRAIGSMYVFDEGRGDRSWDFYLFPGRYFHYSYGAKREDTIIKLFNRDLGVVWWQPNTSPAQLRHLKAGDEDDTPIKEAQFVLLLESQWLKPTLLKTRKNRLGLKLVDVVETDVGGWRVD